MSGLLKYYPDLQGVTLHHRPYFLWAPDWDHDHCELCGAGFKVFGDASLSDGDQTHGWATEDEYDWICGECFSKASVEFAWKVRDRVESDRPDTPPPAFLPSYEGRTITKAPPE